MAEVKRISRTLKYSGTILDVYQDEMLLPNGGTEKWDIVQHRMGAAAIVPVLPDGRIVLVRQYRPALERETLELPAGCRDFPEEDTAICAKRELEEETGYTSESISKLLELKTTVAFCNEMVDIYLARDIVKIHGQRLDAAEEIDVEVWKLDRLLDEIYGGRLQDSKTVAGILAWSNMRRGAC